MDEQRTGAGDRSQDQVLLADLRGMLDRLDPPPAWLVELARLSHGLRAVDLEIAELVADSQVDRPPIAVRAQAGPAEPRLLTFEADGLLIDLQLSSDERGVALEGQLVPAATATVEVRVPAREVRVLQADVHGRFGTHLEPGEPFSIAVSRDGRTVAAPWVI